MRKVPLTPLAFGFIFAVISGASGQGVNYNPNPSSPALNGGLTMPGGNASATAPNSTGTKATDDEDDPTLQRLSSKDSLGQGTMSRDDGQLTAKVRRREKISQVESTKQLPTTGIDPKFQGSLLHSSVGSIQDVGEKANANTSASFNVGANVQAQAQAQAEADADAQAQAEAEAEAKEKAEAEARFKAKRLVFTPMTGGDSKKKESPHTKADSSPSPSPSASATPSGR